MAFRVESVIRRISLNGIKKFSTAVEPVQLQEDQLQILRTSEANPANHTKKHLRRFYTIPPDDKQTLFRFGGLKKQFEMDIKTFNECSIMVRQPALEIISYLRQTDYSKPVMKYVLYGGEGCGKTITLAHLLHYGLATQHLLIHVPWAQSWFRFPKESSSSMIRQELTDLPIDAALWLTNFKIQNKNLLPALDLRATKDYTWSQRESTAKGAPLLGMIDFGINRVKFASEVIISLMEEVKLASIAGKCKTMVVIDGYNAFFSKDTRVTNEKKRFISAKQITLTQAFTYITKNDWNNAVMVLSVDKLAHKRGRDSDLPRYLLGKEGFEHIDPFIPVSVDKYDNEEFETMIEYYKDRMWLRNVSPDGQREIELLTNRNPFKLAELCAGL